MTNPVWCWLRRRTWAVPPQCALLAAGFVTTLLIASSAACPMAVGQDPSCSPQQVVIGNSATEAAMMKNGVHLKFSLAPGSAACTLFGYPGVDSGAGGPLLHAQRTPRGYMGGLPTGDDRLPTVTLTPAQSAHALVESAAADPAGNPCPTYTDLRVTLPDTTDTVTVPATLAACQLQVHPVISDPAPAPA